MTGPDEPTEEIRRRLQSALEARAAEVEPADGALDRLLAAADAAPARRRRPGAPMLLAAAAAVLLVVLAVGAAALRDDDPDALTTVDAPASTTATSAPEPTPSTITPPPPAPTTATAPGPTSVPSTSSPPTTSSPTTSPPLPGASFGPFSGEGNTEPADPALLVDVRTGSSAAGDRVVLEFLDEKLPQWSVSYVEAPILQGGSGEAIAVAGEAFLLIRMESASGFVADGETFRPTYDGPARVPGAGTSLVVEVVRIGEFEGVFTWAIGLRSRAPFAVTTLIGPARLVIDVAQS